MPMATNSGLTIQTDDILWDRKGAPVRVITDADPTKGGKVHVDENFETVRHLADPSLQNGLGAQREAYQTVLTETRSGDVKATIDSLFAKIKQMKESGQNSQLINYLDSELKYKMLKSGYHPRDYSVDPLTLDI